MKKNYFYIVVIALFTVFILAPRTSLAIEIQHKVRAGETLSRIAKKYGVPIKSIAQANNLKSIDHIQTGKKLIIPIDETKLQNAGGPADGTWHIVKDGDTLYNIARKHNIEDWKDIQKINNISNPKHLQIGDEIFIPGNESVGFKNPLRIPLIVTSHYGYRNHPVTGHYRLHEGIDFRASTGTRVYASKTGKVTYASRKGGYGKTVSIQHEDDYSTSYGHLSRIYVSVGDFVRQGQVIGLVGNTGISTGPHLHFEIRYKGKSENPARHLDLP
ncbi:MAG: M23 family metallopeptidase [Candidatus Poribacteria bacterium]|nr:M23 family metallopeptidase [Candidatus Poribacteria bacterium]